MSRPKGGYTGEVPLSSLLEEIAQAVVDQEYVVYEADDGVPPDSPRYETDVARASRSVDTSFRLLDQMGQENRGEGRA